MWSYLGFGGKPKITERMLETQKIQILSKADIKIDKSSLLALTGNGKYYKGFYKNDPVSIKIVDISKEDTIINEFIYWTLFQNHQGFLQLIGVAIYNIEAFLVFEFLAFSLEYALNKNLLKEENKVKIARQSLEILEALQRSGKKTMDIRPGVFGITEKIQIKLLDFGMLINTDSIFNESLIGSSRKKYQPPEYFQNQIDDLSYDIWSFGCLLIDIFSKENPIFSQNYSLTDLQKLHLCEAYPIIPSDITGILRDIVVRCLNRTYEQRIKIDELSTNLKILFDNLLSYYTENGMNQEMKISTNPQIIEAVAYVKQLELRLGNISKAITCELLEKNIADKKIIESTHQNAMQKLAENYTHIKESFAEMVTFKFEALDMFKEKLLNNIMAMQQYFASAMEDIVEAQNIINELKLTVFSLSQFSNSEKYRNVFERIETNQKSFLKIIQKYSENEDFDKITNLYKENALIIDMFKSFANHRQLLMYDLLQVAQDHKEKFIKESNIKQLSQLLKIDTKLAEKEEELSISKARTNNQTYVKAQENSSLVIIYEIQKKKFHHLKLNEQNSINAFPSKCYSFYDLDKSTVYISGGIPQNTTRRKAYESQFFKIKVDIVFDEFKFEYKELARMSNPRSSHSMIKINEDYLLVCSGINTKTCEVYSIQSNEWIEIPELPTIAPNPSCVLHNSTLYVLTGSGSQMSSDGIFKMSLNNLSKVLHCEKGFEGILQWENIDYKFDAEGYPRLRRGMGAIVKSDCIFLFGGFDYDSNYDKMYSIDLTMKPKSLNGIEKKREDPKEEENANEIANNVFIIKELNESLPLKTFFTSNLAIFDNALMMIDGSNNAFEYDFTRNEFYYYT